MKRIVADKELGNPALRELSKGHCLARRVGAERSATVAVLDGLVALRGVAPGHVHCDAGSELTTNALRDWRRVSRAGSASIHPSSP